MEVRCAPCVANQSTRVKGREGERTLTTHASDEAVDLLGRFCPPLTYVMAGKREVNGGGRTKGKLEKRNARKKVFIGFQRVACMSTFGMNRSRGKLDGPEINFDLDQL